MEMTIADLLGRKVMAMNGRSAGRIEECRARQENGVWIIDAYVLGAAGGLERLDLGVRLLLGMRRRGSVARWNQVMLTASGELQLTCDVSELESL